MKSSRTEQGGRFYRAVSLTVAAFLILTPESILGQERANLDLTKIQIRDLPIRSGKAGGGGSSAGDATPGSDTRRPPLSIEVLSPAKSTDIHAGSEFTWEIRIQNVSDQQFYLPWNPSLADFQPKQISQSSAFSAAALSFWFAGGEGRRISLRGTIILYGSPDVKGSMISLGPREWARIRGKAIATPQMISESWSKLQQSGSQTAINLQVGVSLSANSLTQRSGAYEEDIQTFGKISIASQPVPLTLSFR